jgi:dolichyl-phosphate beta-glucosyltransferase
MVNNFFVGYLIGLGEYKDTQCGFKLFSRKAANKIVYNMHLTRWAFDVEMLYISKKLKIPTKEIMVNWREIEGSKLNIITASMSFFRDYFAIIIFYFTGFWRIN